MRHIRFHLSLLCITIWCASPTHATRTAQDDSSPSLEEHADDWTQALQEPQMEVVFVLDTTGSMTGLIAGAKQKIWAIANFLKSAEPTPQIRFGLVGYRDRGDDYVSRIHPLSDNLDRVYEQLHAFDADGGGDTPESVQEALHVAVTQMTWSRSPEVLRVIFLVGDAPPHRDYKNDVPFERSCAIAQRKNITINTIQCGQIGGTEMIWREIAQRGTGAFAAILQDGGTIRFDTPYDDAIVQLNQKLNRTVVPYGDREAQSNARRNTSLLRKLSSEAMADRSSFFGKSSANTVISGRGDLTADLADGRIELEAIDRDELEVELQAMEPAALKAHLEAQVAERRTLAAELAELTRQRDAHIARLQAEAAEEGDVFEINAFEVLGEQAQAKGFSFEERK